MHLSEYLRILRRNALLIGLCVLLGAGGAVAWSAVQERVYATSTTLIVSASVADTAGTPTAAPAPAQLAVTLSQLADTPPALDAAMTAAGRFGVVTSVDSSADGDSPFLIVSVTGSDPQGIADVTNAFAGTLPEVAAELDQLDAGTTVMLAPIDPAPVNSTPSSPRPRRDLLLGVLLGLAVGLCAAFVRAALDRQLRDSADIESLIDQPVLGAIPTELAQEKLPAVTHPASVRSEAYRLVRTNLQFADVPDRPRTLLVTSPAPGDGKTSLATNLAVSCALGGERVVVIDADLRKPRVSQQFGLGTGKGLADLLTAGDTSALAYIQPAANDLISVIPAGSRPRNPAELLGLPAMRELLDELAEAYDRVIIDSPPVLPVADAVRLASMVTGVLVVVRMGKTTRDELVTAQKRLDKASSRVLGVVANGVRPGRDSAYGYGSYGDRAYGAEAGGRLRNRRRR